MMTEIDVLEALAEDDEFFRFYPSYATYRSEWDTMGGKEVGAVPDSVVFEFYAEKIMVEDALHTWFTYDALEQILACREGLSRISNS